MKQSRLWSLVACATWVLTTSLTATLPSQAAPPAPKAPPVSAVSHSGHGYVAKKSVKINVMGEWAHPDDDTSIIGPCGVWHQRNETKCGIIMVTRGEGGGNAIGSETGIDLGLRRENEDRVAHYRSGTVDIFNVDRVDFFYNQSAPLTQQVWDQQETLRRVTRIIRTTQPDVYVGFTPTLAAGHGNHQDAGRLIWEGMLAAADPTKFPEQLRGPHSLSTWQVKKVFSGGSTAGTGGTTTAANCTAGFVPTPGTNLDTVTGVWTGYDSPYAWPKGNLQGQPAGSPKIWQQVSDEGRSAYPTQSRVMYQGTSKAACPRFGMTDAFVPFQPNTKPDELPNPLAGQDDAILFGATKADPGGLPAGTIEHLSFSRFENVRGVPFKATLHVKAAPHHTIRSARAALTVPDGWKVDGPKTLRRVSSTRESTLTFTVTPGDDAPVEANAKISALLTARHAKGYTDNVVRIVPAAEGRFQRWGKWAEYDRWLADTAPEAKRLGRSDAVATIGVGQTASVPVAVHNWSDSPQSGKVSLALPGGITADATSQDYGPLAPGAETTVSFTLTSTDTALPADQNLTVPITTTSQGSSGSSSENLALSVVPTTVVPKASAAPTVDAKVSPGEYTGPKLDIGRIWQGASGCTGTADCGVSGTGDADSSYAQATWSDDALYFFVHVRDDYQSYAVKPDECVAHWLADSVEFQIDPRGDASQQNMDTANTFKLGVFPYTNDPSGSNGNGANGACWERDADNHQGYSTGPLADTVTDAPNAPGVQVASSATWVGDNQTTTDHAYAGGGYDLEVKIPMADLPAAVDPEHMGLNITPYDNDNTAAAGTTTLRHIDNSTRLAWSAFGSVQSDPYRWGHASVEGYTPPPGQQTTPPAPILGHTNLNGVDSPQTVWQSARDGVPIAGRTPAPRHDKVVHVSKPKVSRWTAIVKVTASGAGTAHLFLWSGQVPAIPVYETSCSKRDDPAPDYGLTPCAETDGGIPLWEPDMSGHLVKDVKVSVHRGRQRVTIPLDPAARAKLAQGSRLLLSFETAAGEVQALDVPIHR